MSFTGDTHMERSSGRRKRVMIACVTFETTKVTDPIMFYEANEVHIIHYVKDPVSESGRIYNSFFERVREIVGSSPREIEFVEHNGCSVSDFSAMLRTVLGIIQSLDGECDVYVNISSGTSEYAAAAAIASMMVPGTIPFTVGSRRYTVETAEDVRRTYFVDGKPVGLTRETYDPRAMQTYSIPVPDERLVRALRILDDRNSRGLPVTSGKMVAELQRDGVGLWYRRTENSPNRRQAEAVYYQRDFVDKWKEAGWVEKGEFGNYVLTDEGRNVVETFYVE